MRTPQLHRSKDDLGEFGLVRKQHGRPLLAYASIAGAICLMLWALTSPRMVHGQSQSTPKLPVPVAQAQTMTAEAKMQKAADARMSEAQRQRLRAQIIEASKQSAGNGKPTTASNAIAAKKS